MDHNDLIIDQFTKQAKPFFNSSIHGGATLDFLIKASGATAGDTVLDVACGPGLVACAFAPVVRHVTGIDLTPAMIAQARTHQQNKGLTNMDWQLGDVTRLPFGDGEFSLVTCRYVFHHLTDPKKVFAEMCRVCKPGGKVVVTDVAAPDDAAKAAAFDQVEIWRDPSHVRTLTVAEIQAMFAGAGFKEVTTSFYELEIGIEDQLAKSAPTPEDAEKFRRAFDERPESLGVRVWTKDAQRWMAYPIAVIVGKRG